MRLFGLAVAVGVAALSACAGGDVRPGDTTAVGVDTSAVAAGTTTPAGAMGVIVPAEPRYIRAPACV